MNLSKYVNEEDSNAFLTREIKDIKNKFEKINIAKILEEYHSNYQLNVLCLSLSVISIGFALFSVILQFYFDSHTCNCI